MQTIKRMGKGHSRTSSVNTLANSKTAAITDKEYSSIAMETDTRDTSILISLLIMAPCTMLMVTNIKVDGQDIILIR